MSLHAPLNDETHHMMDAARFGAHEEGRDLRQHRPRARVDEAALVAALERGQDRGAPALDVLEEEPPQPDNPLLHMDNVILTPHVASATARMMPETRRRLGREIALVLQGFWPRAASTPACCRARRSSAGSPIRWSAARTAG